MMNAGAFRHLPVVADGKTLGVLSIRDLLKEIVAHPSVSFVTWNSPN